MLKSLSVAINSYKCVLSESPPHPTLEHLNSELKGLFLDDDGSRFHQHELKNDFPTLENMCQDALKSF